MYNRYIPQADGTFRRSRVVEAAPEEPMPPQTPQEPAEVKSAAPSPRNLPPRMPPRPQRSPQGNNVGSFLKQLLPANFDTEDLMVLLLLLLMSGNSPEQQNNALLTLAIYLFL